MSSVCNIDDQYWGIEPQNFDLQSDSLFPLSCHITLWGEGWGEVELGGGGGGIK